MKQYLNILKSKLINSKKAYNNQITNICYEALPDVYTLEEIKKLSDASHYSYRIGMLDNGAFVAVICIPNPNSSIQNLRFEIDNIPSTIHKYIELSEEVAINRTFHVYPYAYPLEDDKKLQQCCEEILETHQNQTKKLTKNK